jgi:hypothetical protein
MSKDTKAKSELFLLRLREYHISVSKLYMALYRLKLESAYIIIETES